MRRCAPFLSLLLMLASASAGAQETGDPQAGYAFAARTCAECHDIASHHLTNPNSNAPDFYAVANNRDITSQALMVWLQSSHPTMPNLILRPDDIANVIAYILSLKDK